MSKDDSEEGKEPKKKGKGLIGKLIFGLVLLGAGGGGAFGLMQAGIIGSPAQVEEDNNPKLIRKGDEDPYAPPASTKDGEGPVEIHGDGGSEYRVIYYSFSEGFTSNLKASDALVQVSLAASTRRDGRVVMWMKKHELAIRSALLTVLADTDEADLLSVAGKERLQKRLTDAINQVLTKHEGFGGVDSVYFLSLIIQ